MANIKILRWLLVQLGIRILFSRLLYIKINKLKMVLTNRINVTRLWY